MKRHRRHHGYKLQTETRIDDRQFVRGLQAAADQLQAVTLAASASVEVIEAAAGEPPRRPTFTIDAYSGVLAGAGYGRVTARRFVFGGIGVVWAERPRH